MKKIIQQEWFKPNLLKNLPVPIKKIVLPENDTILLKKHVSEKIVFQNSDEIKPKSIFGTNLNEWNLNEDGIPYILLVLTSYFDFNKTSLFQEGIFRLGGSEKEQKEAESELEKLNYNYIYNLENHNVVAGVLKKLLHSMPQPIVTFSCYKELVSNKKFQNETELFTFLKNQFNLMPEINIRVFSYLIEFFNWISTFSSYNKMTPYNLAVVFSPTLFRPKEYSLEDLANAKHLALLLEKIIKNYECIFKKDGKIYEEIRRRHLEKRKSRFLDEFKNKALKKSRSFNADN